MAVGWGLGRPFAGAGCTWAGVAGWRFCALRLQDPGAATAEGARGMGFAAVGIGGGGGKVSRFCSGRSRSRSRGGGCRGLGAGEGSVREAWSTSLEGVDGVCALAGDGGVSEDLERGDFFAFGFGHGD